MGEELTMDHITGGARPTPVVDTDEDDQNQDGDLDLESDEEGGSPLDASKDKFTDEGDDNSSDKSKKAKGGDEDLSSQPQWVQDKFDDLEKKRASYQSQAGAAESDLGKSNTALNKALDLMQNFMPKPGNSAEDDEVTLKSLGIDSDSVVDRDALEKILDHVNGQRSADNQVANSNNYQAQVNAATEKHKDIDEVAKFFTDHNLANKSDSNYLNNLGRFYYGKTEKLTEEIKQLRLDHKAELAKQVKQADGRRNRNDDIPPVLSGSNTLRESVNSLGQTAKFLTQRHKDRSRR